MDTDTGVTHAGVSHTGHTGVSHTGVTCISHTHTHTHLSHTESQLEWKGPSGDDPAQPLPRQGHLKQVTLAQVGWYVSMEGDPAPSLGSCPKAWPFRDGGKFCLMLSWQWECWSSVHGSSSCRWVPPGWVWHHPHTLGRFVGIGGITPHIFVWIGAIPSGERFVWTREQQSKAPCGLRSSGSQAGTERALPGAAREIKMAPGSTSDPKRRGWGRQIGRGAAAGHGSSSRRVCRRAQTPSWLLR